MKYKIGKWLRSIVNRGRKSGRSDDTDDGSHSTNDEDIDDANADYNKDKHNAQADVLDKEKQILHCCANCPNDSALFADPESVLGESTSKSLIAVPSNEKEFDYNCPKPGDDFKLASNCTMAEFALAPNDAKPLSLASPDFNLFCEFIRGNCKLPEEEMYKNLRQYCNAKFSKLRHKARIAKQRGVIYTIFGCYPYLGKLLQSRGWVEKLTKENEDSVFQGLAASVKFDEPSYDVLALSQLVADHTPVFMWMPRYLGNYEKPESTYLNHMKRHAAGDINTKIGLMHVIRRAQPTANINVEQIRKTNFPRGYILCKEKQKKLFVRDFHVGKCLHFLDYLYRLGDIGDKFTMSSDADSVSAEIISYALNEIRLIIECNDLFRNVNETYSNLENNRKMYANFNLVVTRNVKLRLVNRFKSIQSVEAEIREVMIQMTEKFPHMVREGLLNVWIVKPNEHSQRHSTAILNSEQKILELNSAYPELHFVVQKYLERPCLIYKTKFDIRLFTLLTFDGSLASIWMYKNCYFKFCSQEFSLANFHESIHMTNHSVQRNYVVNEKRNKKLPLNNMWYLTDFFKYLRIKHCNCTDVWHKSVYPAIVKTVNMVMYASLSETDLEKNTFELFGIDFALNEEMVPKLMEVNASPELAGATTVSKAVCHAVQEDMLRVIIDVEKNKSPSANTGDFEKVLSIEVSSFKN